MDVHISASRVAGTARAPPSKSYTHRAILAAGYSDGATVYDPLDSADPRATMRAVEGFGGSVDHSEASLEITGFDGTPEVPDNVIDCANSGTTMRLVTAAAALADGITVLTGDDSLRSRPQGPLLEALDALGVEAKSSRHNGQAPLVIEGPLSGGQVDIPGDVSSQYISALLMAGAVSDEGIELNLTTDLKSAPYVDITLEVLEDFGVTAEPVGATGEGGVRSAGAEGFVVAGGQQYSPEGGEYHVPGDFSSMSYLLAAGAIAAADGESVVVEGAYPSAQGDSAIVDILDAMDADIDWDREVGEITVAQSDLTGTTVDVGDTPDLLPTIAVLGAVAEGDTVIENCEHVRYKETDRVSAMATELTKMGVEVTEEHDVLTIHGSESTLSGATVEGYHDHRIIMSLAVAGLVADGTTTVTGGDHVDVSFPTFFDLLADLGGSVDRTE
ncbi:3-phosphoshikimate 1-carboxyvinyltransferase [Halohasta litchfieldiae]|jgi:3-phosphoshikimate 1-carboxyvinyltransferase|uniref:3-phosphoshikimate 1-carboxyvinyltransferase n=1 Tax=Halohasta litchfieldiae TaxID=1073996 RepID=A0A1H6U8B7_9EURY|nr:3-phosphoshikimate 1-carboxyvinyltransferase [Halohasta litchfieldiae]ATW89073.1 3-phosphoshikimate 1-carboxyvinyltransferase [Halohasta litchfieldiae]SEI87756.1 3-phosphoshikimate 1-carboxyvinyltransferase [Halohasta litchfieldiae]